jgi:chromosome segregation protein
VTAPKQNKEGALSMRVKRLEVQGFKSFKDKTVIHFDHTITGIVGPNGCGKSNIVDAFFWVMGEQSYKHMRGSGSEDLIFNGSSKYAPLGFAEATLVMEHDIVDTQNAPAGASSTDEPSAVIKTKEVSVTRRVLRSGEGEYFINGAPARLKDIHELFMDTGIGAKGYSIIEQGQIGKIVNAKPEERRVLIEEAAGIAKYKARKKESLRKMEATQSNLSRLNDVIQEIERSMGSLERQAQKAGRWKRFKEELTEKEMTWGRRKNHVIRQKLDQLKNDKDALDIELLALKTQLLTAENDSESDRTQQLTLNKKAEDLQVQIQAMASELTRSQSQLELSKHRQSDLAQQLESLQSEKIELQESIAYELTQIQSIQAQHEEAQQILESHETVVTSEEEVISISRQKTSDARLQLDDSKRALMNQIAEFSAQNSKVAAQQSRLSSLDENLSKMKAQIIALHQKQAEQESLVSDSVHAYEALVEQKANAEQALNLLKAQFNQKQTEYTEKKLNHSQAQQELTKLESKLQSLVELNESYEGFSDGAKHAFDWIKQKGLSDAFTTLSQSLKIQSGFENATQAWLENKIQTLLCSDTAQAQSLIQYLKTEEKGRIYLQLFTTSSELNSATFLKAKNSFENSGLTVKGLLSDFVECSSTAKGLFDSVIVVDHIPTTLQETFGYHLVSLDGTCLENNGQLRAGSG